MNHPVDVHEHDPRRVEEVLDRLEKVGRAKSVTIESMTEALGERSYGPFLLIPALLDISPLGSIPGVPSALAAILLIFSIQIVIGRKHLWLPTFIRHRSIAPERLQKSIKAIRPMGRWMDRLFHGRLSAMTKRPAVRASGAACVAMTLLIPPLEILPFATTLPTATIGMFGLGLLVRDGLLMIGGFVMSILATVGGLWFLIGW